MIALKHFHGSADLEKTVWVLTNILINAIDYAHENTKVILRVKEIGNKIQFSVQDLAKELTRSIKTDCLTAIFKFRQQQIGHGLGLAISKEFIEAKEEKYPCKAKLEWEVFFYPTQQST